jgi:hypothetical protein
MDPMKHLMAEQLYLSGNVSFGQVGSLSNGLRSMLRSFSLTALPARYKFHQHVNAWFFAQKTKKLLVFESEFYHAFSYENCASCTIR